jgi:hypothetical protein
MTLKDRQIIESACRSKTGEYKRIMQYIGLPGQLKVFALACVGTNGVVETRAMCRKIEKILGFKDGEIQYKFHSGWGTQGSSRPLFKEIDLGTSTILQTIVHEMTHVLCHKETTIWGTLKFNEYGECKRTNTSVHNRGFAEWLNMAMDNVLEHAEELGIRVYTAEDILREW